MSGLDIAARGLARGAINATDALQGPSGAALVRHKRNEAAAIVEPVSDLLRRLDISPTGFGALYDPGTSDHTALAAFTAAMGAAAQGLVRLEPKTHYLGQSSAADRLGWSQSNAGLIGAGIDRTIIRNMTTNASSGSLIFTGSCENVVFSDMTFHGRTLNSGANSMKSIIFNRCKFTTDPTVVHNALHLNPGGMTGGIEFIYFIDCIFHNGGRMNCEIQNNVADTVVRYANLYFIRPRFIGAGQASAATGMGLSLSGYGDTVVLDRPWFDGNKLVHLENVGCSRLRVRDMMVRQSTHPTGRNCVSFSNTRPMNDCEIDGFHLVGDVMANLSDRPAIDNAVLSISNAHRLRLNRIKAAVNNTAVATKVVYLNNNGAGCSNVTVDNCDLWSNSNGTVLEFLNTTGSHVVQNSNLTSTHTARTTALVAAFGSSTVQISRNRISSDTGTAATLFAKSGTGALSVTHDNSGVTSRYSAVHTITAGQTSSPLANHGLPGLPLRFSCRPRANTGGAVWASNHTTNTQIRANIPATLGASVDVEVEAEYAW